MEVNTDNRVEIYSQWGVDQTLNLILVLIALSGLASLKRVNDFFKNRSFVMKSCFMRLWAREDHHIIFLIKTVTDALRAHEIEYADLYIDTLAATDFWRTSSTPSVFVLREMDRLVHTMIHLTEYQEHLHIIDIVTKLCGHTTVGEKMFREVGGNCGYFLRALMSTFPDNYLQWTYDTILDGSQKMNQQHQITTALDLIEMAIQDVVSPDVTVAKCVDVHSFLTAWVTIHGSMRLSNEQAARMMVYYDDTVHHISRTPNNASRAIMAYGLFIISNLQKTNGDILRNDFTVSHHFAISFTRTEEADDRIHDIRQTAIKMRMRPEDTRLVTMAQDIIKLKKEIVKLNEVISELKKENSELKKERKREAEERERDAEERKREAEERKREAEERKREAEERKREVDKNKGQLCNEAR
jgi:hypothetical protein